MWKYNIHFRILKTVFVFLFIQSNAFGQSRIEYSRKQIKEVNRETRKLIKELSLTKEQTLKIKDLKLSLRSRLNTLRTENMTPEEKKQFYLERKILLQKADSALKAILTSEQLSNLEAKAQKDIRVRLTYEPELFKKKVRITQDR